ncbi:MAG: DUF533 domain-containing protein [Sedimenticolaceae bacterium]
MANIDAMKILGSLLNSGALSRGSASNILGSVIGAMTGGGQTSSAAPASGAAPTSGGGLSDLVGGMLGGGQQGQGGGLGSLLGGLLGGSRQATGTTGGGGGLGDLLGMAMQQFGGAQQGASAQGAARVNMPQGLSHEQAEQQAELLVRAMINAAKSDGKIDAAEQQKIVERLGDVTPDEIAFVRREFETPLDAQAFVRSVPKGMEQEVYVVSLMAIDLDHNAEAKYLHELAQGFGMRPEACNQIHQQLGAPALYR